MKQRWMMVMVGLALTLSYRVAADSYLAANMLGPAALLPLYLILAGLIAAASYLRGRQRFPLG